MPVGFGGYRIDIAEPEHREALKAALLNGCNLVDTASGYGNGNSEKLVGSVLEELISKNQIQREEVIVVTKAGYVQGDNLALAREKAKP